MISPLILSGSRLGITLGQKLPLSDEKAFVNPSNEAMLVDELRFCIVRGPAVPQDLDDNQAALDTALGVRVRIEIDRMPLTADYIPITLLGRYLNEPVEMMLDDYHDGMRSVVRRYCWRFKRPLLIPAGKKIEISVYYAGGFAEYTSAFDFYATAIGRSLGAGFPMPDRIFLPYAVAWLVPVIPTEQDVYYNSTESDLVNPFGEIFRVREVRIEPGSGAYLTSPSIGAAVRDAVLRIVDHRGQIIVRDDTPVAQIAQTMNWAWKLNADLAPRGFWKARLRTLSVNEYMTQFGMSLVGYHEIPILGSGR